jgi:hypothetical protein
LRGVEPPRDKPAQHDKRLPEGSRFVSGVEALGGAHHVV